jgi:hypothetical protein
MKLPKEYSSVYGVQSLIQIIFLVIALFTHDWFWLAACFVMSPSYRRNINYDGHE